MLRTTWTELTQHSHALVARTAEALVLGAGALSASADPLVHSAAEPALSAGAPTASPARAGP